MAGKSKVDAEQLKCDFASGEYTKKQLALKHGISYVYTCTLLSDKSVEPRPKTQKSNKSAAASEIQNKLSDLQIQRNILDSQIKDWTTALKAVRQGGISNENTIEDQGSEV